MKNSILESFVGRLKKLQVRRLFRAKRGEREGCVPSKSGQRRLVYSFKKVENLFMQGRVVTLRWRGSCKVFVEGSEYFVEGWIAP